MTGDSLYSLAAVGLAAAPCMVFPVFLRAYLPHMLDELRDWLRDQA